MKGVKKMCGQFFQLSTMNLHNSHRKIFKCEHYTTFGEIHTALVGK